MTIHTEAVHNNRTNNPPLTRSSKIVNVCSEEIPDIITEVRKALKE